MAADKIVAVGLLTEREVQLLGHGFTRLWPVDETPCFADLIRAIDEADRQLREGAPASEEEREDHGHPVPGGGRY